MFKRVVGIVQVVVLAAVLVFAVMLFANEPGGDAGDGGSITAASSPGATIFAANSARCHGSDGSGGIGPQLSDGAVVDAFPAPAAEVRVVTNGRGGMPAFGDRLSSEEIEQVVEYTRSL